MSNVGIMNCEARNAILNAFGWKKGQSGFVNGIINGFIFEFAANYRNYHYRMQASEEYDKLMQEIEADDDQKEIHDLLPTDQPYAQIYPEIYTQLRTIFESVENLQLFRDSYRTADESTRMLTVIDYDKEELNEVVCEYIKSCGFKFRQKKKWNSCHYTWLLVVCSVKNRWKTIDSVRLSALLKSFKQQFPESCKNLTLDDLCKKCQDVGLDCTALGTDRLPNQN